MIAVQQGVENEVGQVVAARTTPSLAGRTATRDVKGGGDVTIGSYLHIS